MSAEGTAELITNAFFYIIILIVIISSSNSSMIMIPLYNNNNECLEHLAHTDPKCLHILYKHIVKIQCIQHECAHTHTHTCMHAHTHTHTHAL